MNTPSTIFAGDVTLQLSGWSAFVPTALSGSRYQAFLGSSATRIEIEDRRVETVHVADRVIFSADNAGFLTAFQIADQAEITQTRSDPDPAH